MKTNCTICNSERLKEIIIFEKFPVFMGATDSSKDSFIFNDLIYGNCLDCNNLQILDLIDLNILYQENHNTEVVGKIWENHNLAFSNFVKQSKPDIVLEIGSPSATIYKKIQNKKWLKKWYSIEPNPCKIDGIDDKYKTIIGFVDEKFSFNKFKIEKAKTIVMSHVFEHLYNPSQILNVLFNQLPEGGSIIISIPNMDYISKQNLMPPSGLHFEHSYYIDLNNAKFLFENSGFEIEKTELFENHSIFIKAVKLKIKTKSEINNQLKKINAKNINNFNNTIIKYKKIINKINTKMNTSSKNSVYVYGSHFPAQFFKCLNLNSNKISGCLDQSKTKIGKTLYGTNWIVYHPDILKNKKNVSVICYMGPYTDEIKKTLLKINNKIKFL
jgi:predicted SAM-dependent methyltransferase